MKAPGISNSNFQSTNSTSIFSDIFRQLLKQLIYILRKYNKIDIENKIETSSLLTHPHNISSVVFSFVLKNFSKLIYCYP